MRARNIKPALFSNELLGTADPLLTILFIGLWCLADREGRLEDRPLRIKALIFPYRNVDVEGLLLELGRMGFIKGYLAGNSDDGGDMAVIEVVNFRKHQNPHPNETPSKLLPSREKVESTQEKERIARADSLIPDSLIPDSKPLPQISFAGECDRGLTEGKENAKRPLKLFGEATDDQIEKVYQLYPRKVGKEDAKRAIRKAVERVRKGDCDHPCMPTTLEALDFLADRIRLFAESTRMQDRKFIKHPATWFNDGCYWDDPNEWSVTSQPAKTWKELELENFDREMERRRQEQEGA